LLISPKKRVEWPCIFICEFHASLGKVTILKWLLCWLGLVCRPDGEEDVPMANAGGAIFSKPQAKTQKPFARARIALHCLHKYFLPTA